MDLSLTLRTPSLSSSSSSAPWKHDVFLSFKGEDTRIGFTGFLYGALVREGLNAYRDDEKLRIGKLVRLELLQAIEESKSAVVILSENYADSTWCLDELAKIAECVETRNLILYPVFYKVDPSDVRRQRNMFDLAKYETDPEIAEGRVVSWRRALHKVGHTAGLHVEGKRCESEDVSEIVRKIYLELEHTSPIDLDEKMENLESLLRKLNCRQNDVELELRASELYLGTKKKRDVVNYWLERVETAKTEFESLKQELRENGVYSFSYGQLRKHVQRLLKQMTLLNQESSFPDGNTIDVHGAVRGVAFPTADVVLGKTFQANCEEVLKYLKDDHVSSIGIFGMGGVGKTTVMKQVHNQILADPITFGAVCWVTVSQNFTILQLQEDISKKLKHKLPSKGDEMSRAASLFAILEKMKGKYILILDDVWEDIPLVKVGIPVGVNLCRLIVTTRSLDICNKMVCQQKIKISPLFWEEAWELFMEKLGPQEEFTPEVKTTAKDVARMCGGLPLAIITMAGSMRGISDIHEWRNALEELKKPETFTVNDMKSKVLRVLEYSYNHLGDEESQLCFLSCALYPEDYEIPRYELIQYCIVMGLIKKRESWRAEIDKGHTMINKLEKCCLLEHVYDRNGESVNGKYGEYVKMHDLVREMALHIMKSRKQQVMVKDGFELMKIPEEEEWTEDLEVVSLIDSGIREIPDGRSPRCPKLSTLMLLGNKRLTHIPYSFFVHMNNLHVLNLRDSNLRMLPDSVGDLTNLMVLWLGGCHELCHIPSLRKLKKLTELDLSNTKIRFAPDGLGELISLRCLYMDCSVSMKGLTELQQLEVFRGWVRDVSNYNILVKLTWFQQLWDYHLFVTDLDRRLSSFFPLNNYGGARINKLILEKLSLRGRGVVDVPCGIKRLNISFCYNTGKCLLDFGKRGENARSRELKEIEIQDCNEVEWVVAMPSSPPDVQLPGIEVLHVIHMNNMKGIFNWWEYCDSTPSTTIPIPTPSHGGSGNYNQSSFSRLKRLYIDDCPKMKVGLTVNCLVHLPVLEKLYISHCPRLEEIIGGRGGEDHHGYRNNNISISISDNIRNITLPNLKLLFLEDLPSLTSIYNKANMICDSIEDISLYHCTKLKRLPLTTTNSTSCCSGGSPRPPFPSLKKIHIDESNEGWWESLELVHPSYHPLLRPFLRFSGKLY